MESPILFQDLTKEDKVGFFVKCQEILKNHHPDSPFIFRASNFNERKTFFKDFYEKYKGFAYQTENVCILFNKIALKDPKNPIESVKNSKWHGPNEDYNAFMIDWVVFDLLESCLSFCKSQYNNKIRYIIFGRNNDIKVYETDKLLKKLSTSQGLQFLHH